jgi:hypothetical protein
VGQSVEEEVVVVQEGMGQMLATMGLGEGMHRHIALVCLLLTSKRQMRGKVGRGRKFVHIRIERIFKVETRGEGITTETRRTAMPLCVS